MAGLLEIRRHVRSVKNVAQVTRAMQMVSASKMRRAQESAIVARAFTDRAWRLLTHLASEKDPRSGAVLHRLFEQRPVTAIELLLVTASRGFCGALNHAVIQEATRFVLQQSVPVSLVTVGAKGRSAMMQQGQRIVAEFAGVSDDRTLEEVEIPIAEVLMDDFERGLCDAVYIVFALFVNTLVQQPTLRQLLPIPVARWPGRASAPPYVYEPEREQLLADLVPRLTSLQVALALREAIASEHSARMVAMREASDNADSMLDHLTMQANRLRQRTITQEVLEVSEGAAITPSMQQRGLSS